MLAAAASVEPASVEVTIAAGSVVLSVLIRAPTAAAATAAGAAIAPHIASPQTASALLVGVSSLSIAVEAVTPVDDPTLSSSPLLSPSPSPPPLPSPPQQAEPEDEDAVNTGAANTSSALTSTADSSSTPVILAAVAVLAILVLLLTLFVVLRRWRRRTGGLGAAAAKPVAVIVDSAEKTDTKAVTSTSSDEVQLSIASAADGAIAVHGEDEPQDAKASDRVSHPEEVEVEMAGVGESTDTLSSTAIGSPGASAKALGVAVQGSASAGSAGALASSSSRSLRNTRALQAMAEWDWKAADLTWMKKIGFGSFGAVFKVQHGDEFLAAKRIKSDDSDEARAEMESMLVREFRALSKVAHENVVHLLGVVRDDPSYVCLLMELADHGSLRQVLDARPGDIVGDLPVQSALAFDIANGLAFCHAQV